jgi:two-component system nitrogen regulation response regulator GlnG
VLVRYPWPGNVRELENVIYRSAVIAQGDAILVKDLPAEIRGPADADPPSAAALPPAAAAPAAAGPVISIEEALDLVFDRLGSPEGKILQRMEREMASRALKAEGGNATAAAKRLGITKAALLRKTST